MDLHVSIKPETLWSLGPLNITNSFITMVMVMVGLIVVGHLVARKASVVPTHGQSIFEMTVEFLLNLVESTAGPRVGRRIFPLIGGLFIFIIVANYAGLLPGVGTVGLQETHAVEEEAMVASATSPDSSEAAQAQEEEHAQETVLIPFLRSPSADLNMTLAMAALVVFIVQIAGFMAHGVGGRLKEMAGPSPFLAWLMFPLEIISEVGRIVSLAFRLFGNVFAGEVLIAVMVAFGAATFFVLTPFTTVFLYLEVLFGFVQALVFALLSLVYLALATAGGHEEHGEEAHEH